MKSCFEDWESARGVFEDAGVAEDMEFYLENDFARESWDVLNAHTWTMGNSDGED